MSVLAGVALCAFTVRLFAEDADSDYSRKRDALVETKIKPKGIDNPRVLEAMRSTPRHLFLPDYVRAKAYEDVPLPLGQGQFDPPPSLVAEIAEALSPTETDTVFIVGIGSGYMCAVFSKLCGEVYTSDINQTFLYQAMGVFEALAIANIQSRLRDGSQGWEPPRFFDYIIVDGAVNHIPQPLVDSLRVGGKMVVPLGNPYGVQNLVIVTKTEEGITLKSVGEVIFAPLKGKALDQSDKKEYPFPYEEQRGDTSAYLRSPL
jgi:protein-L-isoaspartate(D-aspartate) O-methyltransferase